MKKYAIYCETDGKFEHVISDSIPTQCPINGAHTIDSDRVRTVDSDVKVNFENTIVDSSVSLSDYKEIRYNEIDYKTGTLIAPGFTYDGKTFSTSANAQLNWSEIHSNTSEFSDPIIISTIESDEYSLSHANVNAFWSAGKSFVQGHLDSGRALKKQIFDVVNDVNGRANIDAIADNR